MSTSGSIAARSDGWYICFTPAFYRRPDRARRSEGPQPPRRPRPIHRQVCAGDGATSTDIARRQHEDPIDLGCATRLAAPEPGHLAMGVDVVVDHSRELVALRGCRGF